MRRGLVLSLLGPVRIGVLPALVVLVKAVVILALLASTAMADDVRPVQVLVKELPSGEYDVQWSVPKIVKPQAMPSPRLPDGSRPVGERTFIDRPSAWLTRQVYECPDGLAGRPLGIDFPLYNIGLSTLMRVEFQSGDRYARMLAPGEDTWLIPETSGGGVARRLGELRTVLVDGVNHFFTGWVHLAFLLVICLLGDARVRIRLTSAFFLAQIVAAILGSRLIIDLPLPLAEIGVALATVLLAVEALRPPEKRRQLITLAACAGLVHGLGVPGLMPHTGPGGDSRVLDVMVFVLGMDAALLMSVTLVSGLGLLTRGLPRPGRLVRATVYGVAGLSFALAINALINSPEAGATEGERRLELPSMMTPSTGRALPGSRRVASTAPDAAIQSFLAIEAFEVRHEVLVRLRDVADLVGVGPGPELVIEDQDDVKARVRELVRSRVNLEIDGMAPEPVSERIDFMTLDAKGSLPRLAPVPEQVETAWIGVTTVYLTRTVAQDVSATWTFIGADAEIPATVTDPEISTSIVLTPREPTLRWENALAEDPVPNVSAIAVEPARLTVPIWSIAPLVAALVFAVAGLRRRRSTLPFALVRLMLAFAIFLGPVGTMAIAMPAVGDPTPNAGEAKRILARVLPNVYRALEFREESAVFDRLALSVKGETLAQVYLDHRRGLELEERGGARARVEAVEVINVESVEPAGSGGFAAEAVWTVGGTVTHFGHRHFRQNRYDARVTLVPDEGNWKLQAIEVWDEERIR